MAKLDGIRVAAVVTDGFEQSELTKPKKALEAEGAEVDVIAPKSGKVRGWSSGNWAEEISVDCTIDESSAEDYTALLLPGGVMSPDRLRMIPSAVAFIRAFVQADKPIAAICHGPWTLIDAGGVAGRRMTSWPSLEKDLRNAGADWVDLEVVVDGKLVTSRKPADIPVFVAALIRELERARPAKRTNGREHRAVR